MPDPHTMTERLHNYGEYLSQQQKAICGITITIRFFLLGMNFAQYTTCLESMTIELPFSKSSTALEYINKKKPSYIVSGGEFREQHPYREDWLINWISNSRAITVYDDGNTISENNKYIQMDTRIGVS